MDGLAALPVERLRDLLKDRASPELLSRLPATGVVETTELRAAGLDVQFDPGELTVRIVLPLADQQVRTVALRPQSDPDPGNAASPARVSVGVSGLARPSYAHVTEDGDEGFQPFRGEVRGFVAAGGFDGWVLTSQFDYDDGRDDPWRRREAVLIKDDFVRAIRYEFGDVRPVAREYQSAVDLLGISVERDYEEIQPFRNLRPRGRTSFTLETRARVTVEVNGAPSSVQELPAGVYDLRDFPFVEGANDVRVLVDDGVTIREIASFSTYIDTQMLGPGISRFGASLGFLRDRSVNDRIDYSDAPAFTGYYERGLASALTVSGQVQASEDAALVGVGAVTGLKLGRLAFGTAASARRDGDPGWAGVVRWRSPTTPWGDWTLNADAQAEYKTAEFSELVVSDPGVTPARRSDETRVDLRVSGSRRWLSLGATVSSVFGEFDETSFTLFAGVRARGVTAGLSWQPVISDRPDAREDQLLFTVSRPLGRPQESVRARYVTEDDEVEAEWVRFTDRGVGDLGARATVNRRAGVAGFDGEVGYISPRGEIDVRNVTLTEKDGDAVASSVTEARLGLGFGWADGAAAFGRPFDKGFVIVKPHETLGPRTVAVREGAGGPILTHTGRLGPALAPITGSYRPNDFAAEVDDLPVGYDLGEGKLTTFANARAGYVYQVGSAAANTVMGVLLKDDGTPLALAVGELVPVSGEEARPVTFFTNRAGRMAAERVAPGRYEIRLKADGRKIGELEVPGGEAGLRDLGTVTVGGGS